MDPRLAKSIESLSTAMQSSLDPVAILDTDLRLVHATPMMRTVFSLRARELSARPVFCDLLRFAACDAGCCFRPVVEKGEAVKLDEAAATLRGASKHRFSVHAVPILSQDSFARPVGVYIALRDSTAEVLLQAKYHKVMGILQARQREIEELQELIAKLRKSLRNGKS